MNQQQFPDKKVLTMDELCAYTGLAKSYIYKLTMQGIIPGGSKPTGKKYFFDREKIDQWLLSNPTMTYEERETKASTYLATK